MASKKQQQQQGGMPVLDRSKANDMNMMVLKRIDSQIEEILTTAGHVCLYRMSVDDQQWQRKNIEGSLFLIKRRTQPRFQMLVLNKLSTDNYTEPIHGGLELETNPPYLMYTHGNDEIHGIWFFDETDLNRVSALMNKILAQLPKPDSSVPPAQHQPQQQQQQQPAAVPPAVQEQHHGALGFAGEAPPAAAASSGSRGGDGFWDRSVRVTEETLHHNQQLVPNSSLLDSAAPNTSGLGGLGGGSLQGLLKAAQQKHSSGQRPPAAAGAGLSPVPTPNSTSMPAEPAPAAGSAGAAALLTPAFFEQQQQQQHKQAVPAATHSMPPVAAAAPEASASPAVGASNGPGPSQGGNPLQQLLSRAAKTTPGGSLPSSSSLGGARGGPQPPIGVLSPEAVRDKLKAALIRLANNEVFVDALAQELRTVGLLQ